MRQETKDMREKKTKKKKSLLWRLIRAALYLMLIFLVTAFLFLCIFFYAIFSGSDDEMVDSVSLRNSLGGETQNLQMTRGELKHYELQRNLLAYSINPEIKSYYKRTGFYPKSLNDLPIGKTDEFIKYHRGIHYYSGKKDKPQFYRLSWLASSPWNGMQCVGGIKPTDPSGHELIGEQAEPVDGDCYVLDYH